MHKPLRELTQDLISIVMPTACIVCGKADRDICQACRLEVREGAQILSVKRDSNFETLWLAAGIYDEGLRRMIVGLKHESRVGLAADLGHVFAPTLDEALLLCHEEPFLVTVPSRKSKTRQRGFNPLALVCKRALAELGLPARLLKQGVLQATRGRTGQVGLDAQQRAQNASKLKVARLYKSVVQDKEIVLIDDVITTGSTLIAATNALQRSGATVRAAAAVAVATARREEARKKINI